MKVKIKKIVYIIFFFLILINNKKTFAISEQPIEDPIDKAYSQCIENCKGINSCFIKCSYESYTAWDKALNEVYKNILLKLKNKSKLRNAQQIWIKFRDEEFKLIDEIFSYLEGSMWIPIRINKRTQIVKKRTEELRNYLFLIKINN